jgi:hypothetical protein
VGRWFDPSSGSHSSGWVEHPPLALNTTAPASSSRRTGLSALKSAHLGRAPPVPAHSLPVRTQTGGPEDTPQCPVVEPEDTDFELLWGEKAESELTQLG